MKESELFCPFCHKPIHPGDQVCLHCGAKIPNASLNLNDLTKGNSLEDKTRHKPISFSLWLILGCLIFILLIALLTYFFFLRGRL